MSDEKNTTNSSSGPYRVVFKMVDLHGSSQPSIVGSTIQDDDPTEDVKDLAGTFVQQIRGQYLEEPYPFSVGTFSKLKDSLHEKSSIYEKWDKHLKAIISKQRGSYDWKGQDVEVQMDTSNDKRQCRSVRVEDWLAPGGGATVYRSNELRSKA